MAINAVAADDGYAIFMDMREDLHCMFKRMPVSFKANGKFCVCYGGEKSRAYQKDGIPVTAYDKGENCFPICRFSL